MTIPTRRLLMVVAAAAAVLTLAGCDKLGGGGAASTADAMTMGKADAPVKIEEYASTTCSHCARFNKDVFPAFKAKYIDTGKVLYTFHEFPTEPAAVAVAGFLTARCAGKDKYFGVLDALFQSQEEMFRTGDARGTLLKVAQSAGMTEAQFNTCVNDETAQKAIAARIEAAVKRGVNSTPAFYVNGKALKAGELTLEELDAAVAGGGK